jgi:HEAT repeat protein
MVHLTYSAMLVSLALSAFVVVAAPATASPDAGQPRPERAKVEAYLQTHDVASAAELRGVLPAPEKTLMIVTSDEHEDRLVRARAVAALRLFPSPAVQEFLERVVQDKATATDATDRLIVRRAAIALGWMASADAPEILAALFANEDPEVRLDAALGISMSRAEAAVAILRKQLVVETSPRVRQHIERQLVALGADTSAPEKGAGSKNKQPTRQPMRGGF